jgi:hypothetical protein
MVEHKGKHNFDEIEKGKTLVVGPTDSLFYNFMPFAWTDPSHPTHRSYSLSL